MGSRKQAAVRGWKGGTASHGTSQVCSGLGREDCVLLTEILKNQPISRCHSSGNGCRQSQGSLESLPLPHLGKGKPRDSSFVSLLTLETKFPTGDLPAGCLQSGPSEVDTGGPRFP